LQPLPREICKERSCNNCEAKLGEPSRLREIIDRESPLRNPARQPISILDDAVGDCLKRAGGNADKNQSQSRNYANFELVRIDHTKIITPFIAGIQMIHC
jgi:hypothetical protein